MADFEGRVRGLGRRIDQRIGKPVQKVIKENVDDPLDVIRARMAAAMAGPPQPQPDTSMDTPMNTERQPMAPGVPQDQRDSRTNAMLAAAENMKALKERESAMRMKLDQEDAVRAQEEANFDPSSYKPYNREESPITPPARFGGLKAKMQGEQGALTNQDVNAMAPPPQQGMIELSEDPEEQQRQIAAARLGR